MEESAEQQLAAGTHPEGDAPHSTRPAGIQAVRDRNRLKFETELEFVQSLANPFYLQSLAQQNFLSDPSFLRYLRYLRYWQEPAYARFVVYPHALAFLDLLQRESFRQAIAVEGVAQVIHQKQFHHWSTWREPLAEDANAPQEKGQA